MFEGVIDDQGRLNKRCHVTDTVPTLRSESHGNQPKAILEVEVKQATSKGYSLARGAGCCQPLDAGK